MDIAEKLGNWIKHATNGQKRVLTEAKQEIERLREALHEIYRKSDNDRIMQMVDAALQQKEAAQ